MKSILIVFIKGYVRLVSPILPATCRFHPTCSHYAIEAIEHHGALKGSFYGLRRLLRCQPYYKGDFYDPVPQTKCVHHEEGHDVK